MTSSLLSWSVDTCTYQASVVFRYTIYKLLQHPFFSSEELDDTLRVVVNAEKVNSNLIPMQVVFENKKESGGAREAVEFTYDLKKDEPDEVAADLVRTV